MRSDPRLAALTSDEDDMDDMVVGSAVAEWMDREGLGEGPITDVSPLLGGTQNVMLQFVRAGRTYVLRRGPVHLRPHSNRSIQREMRLLGALRDTEVPHPRLIAGCPDTNVLDGAAFYLMEAVDGFNPAVALPPYCRSTPGAVASMGEAMVDALAVLGDVDYRAAGLQDFGRPDGFLERQVPRWLDELASFRKIDARHPGLAGVDQVAKWLRERAPQQWSPGIIHGDYQVANVMFRHDGPELAAIVDWEMATIGDPLLDLGWLLALWPERQGEPDLIDSALSRAGNLPTGANVVQRYAENSRRDMSSIDWYRVLGAFKAAIVFEGTQARARAGLAPIETGDRLHRLALAVLERGRHWMESAA